MRWILAIMVGLLLVLQYRLWVGPGSWAQIASLQRELAEQQQVNARLQERNRQLELDVKGLKNGLQGVEEQARSELGLIKDGETFYMLIDR